MKLWRRIAMKNGKGSGNLMRKMMKQGFNARSLGENAVSPLLKSLMTNVGLMKAPVAQPQVMTQVNNDIQDVEVK